MTAACGELRRAFAPQLARTQIGRTSTGHPDPRAREAARILGWFRHFRLRERDFTITKGTLPMDELDPPHSAPLNHLVLLRPQSRLPSSPLSEGVQGTTDTCPVENGVDEELHEQSSRVAPRLALISSLPTIHLDQELHVVFEQAMRALSADPLLFSKGDQLVRVALDGEMPHLVALGSAQLREPLSVRAKWMLRGDPVHPPASVATGVTKRGNWTHIRKLRAITTFPVLSSGGELRTRQGYDLTTRTYHAGGTVVRVFDEPTHEDAKAACARLLDLVSDFPFAGEAHRSAWLVALLTPLSRFMHDGNAPLVVIQANMPGSGKSTLAQLIATIVVGAPVPVMACEKGEPNRKEILAKLRGAPSLALIDNVVARFGGPNMATLITGRSFEDRSLGQLKTLSAPNDTTWIITGNRILLARDMARRCLHVRLQSDQEKPHLRDGFRYPNLMQHAREHRGELLSAALTILKAYAVARKREMDLDAWGSFQEWSTIVRGAVVWCGLPDPATTRQELEEEAEEGIAEHARLVEAWEQLQLAMGRKNGSTVRDALSFLERKRTAAPLLRELLDGMPRRAGQPDPLVIARRLREAKDRNLGDKMLRSMGNPKEALRWHVDSLKA
jgi:hypothetical protein